MTATVLDPRTALVVVDLQNAVLGFPYSHPIGEVTANAGHLARAFRRHELPVVVTTVGGPAPAATRIDRPFRLPAMDVPPNPADPVGDLDAALTDHRVVKRRWGSFTDTDLEAFLRQRGVTQIVLTGVATGFGVESTARHGAELGFNVTLAIDAMTDMDAEVHANSVSRIFPRLGECATTQEILGLLEEGRPVGGGYIR